MKPAAQELAGDPERWISDEQHSNEEGRQI